jgi:hypothetical protein
MGIIARVHRHFKIFASSDPALNFGWGITPTYLGVEIQNELMIIA